MKKKLITKGLPSPSLRFLAINSATRRREVTMERKKAAEERRRLEDAKAQV